MKSEYINTNIYRLTNHNSSDMDTFQIAALARAEGLMSVVDSPQREQNGYRTSLGNY